MDALKDVNLYLSELQHLTYLDLSRLHIHAVPEFLGSMQRLRYLSLQGGEGDAIPIPSSSISNLTNLRALFLDDFTFTNLTASTWLAPLSSLQYLGLKDMDLPMNLYKVMNLVYLDLSRNQITGSIPESLQPRTPNLRSLLLNDNFMNGSLPSSLGNLKFLSKFDVSNNKLSGKIPSTIWNLSSLEWLHLNNNKFQEKLPSFLSNMKNLILLDVGENQRSVNLDLSNNFLSGSIPTGISFLSKLVGLNFSYNNLSGKIPERIGDMRSLESIDLSHNHLSGAIPRSMIDLNFLSHLNLSYNNLSESIPIENQFQTLNDPLSYTGNQYLSGAPLPKYCLGDGSHHVPTFEGYEDEDRENDQLGKALFYSIVSFGFATGFWVIIGFLYFKNNWRYACFEYVEKV
ncbi:LRR receptor-like serine/threonine-protein kinase GSO2 [Arachis ipaensis]|uniref:LRR receptor-like serine/threonine-protein kinase GSO2 n=1 Tax=Arachis ipaensis TaxID=130454 RepID=UPI0007AF1AF2|nr:LRR receptor-like serine/threonine-protein kinase GSO2 [Arachis ipaensis]XP_025669807.1 LRR receptor-like serine/threonine-protein kinase GSO2 [Arachis hypogaea]